MEENRVKIERGEYRDRKQNKGVNRSERQRGTKQGAMGQ